MLLRRESWGFVIGSLLFALAAAPGYARWVGVDGDNITYFVGSLFFTAAGFIALRLSGRPVPTSESARVERFDWWAAAIVFGSLAFLVTSALAVVATTETDKLWDPQARDWRSTWLNMVGSIAFGVSAVGAFVRPSTGQLADAALANAGTFIGALCFLAAALLMRPLGGIPNKR